MNSARTVTKNLDEFKKIVTKFKSLGEKLGDDNETYVLLNSLLEAYKEVKNILKYGRESITTDAIIQLLKSKNWSFMLQR